MDLNKVMLIGRLTHDPEPRATPQGASICTFSIATGFAWKDPQGQLQKKTEFHNIVAWRRLADICAQYLRKGKQVYIEGHLQTRSWQDQSGVKKYRTEVVADNMIMLGGPSGAPGGPMPKPDDGGSPSPEPIMHEPAPTDEVKVEDIPF
jgi:single-strand DNA-binding protein